MGPTDAKGGAGGALQNYSQEAGGVDREREPLIRLKRPCARYGCDRRPGGGPGVALNTMPWHSASQRHNIVRASRYIVFRSRSSRPTGQPLGRWSFRVVYLRIRPSGPNKMLRPDSFFLDCGFEFPRARDNDDPVSAYPNFPVPN